MKKTVEIEYCDEDGFDEINPEKNIATRTCTLCGLKYCDSPKHSENDTNYTTLHFTYKPDLGFICKKDWEIVRSSDKYKGLKKLFDHHASGSSFAIAIANYYDGIMFEAKKIADGKLKEFMHAAWQEKEKEMTLRLKKKEIEEELRKQLEDLGV